MIITNTGPQCDGGLSVPFLLSFSFHGVGGELHIFHLKQTFLSTELSLVPALVHPECCLVRNPNWPQSYPECRGQFAHCWQRWYCRWTRRWPVGSFGLSLDMAFSYYSWDGLFFLGCS